MTDDYSTTEICRLCTVKSGMRMHIFDKEGEQRQLSYKIRTCLPIIISKDDSLPKKICHRCAYKLDMFYEFRLNCLNSETLLKNHVTNGAQFTGKLFIMNSHIKSQQFNIKLEDDPLAVAGIKLEPLDVKCDKTTEAEDCDSFHEHIDIKEEVEPLSDVACVKNVAEVDGIQEPFYKLLEDYETKLQSEHKNDDHITDIVTDLYGTALQEEKCDYIGDHVRENANICSAHENPLLKHTSSSKCSQIADKCFQCSVCNKSYALKSRLTRHMYMHSGEKPFTCTTCSKSFSEKSKMVKHMLIHENLKPYTCHFCTKSFYDKRHLAEHIRTHTKEKPYSCYICQKRFPRQKSITEHIRRHSKEKPFTCNCCAKSFADRFTLIKHTHNNHK